MKALLLTDNASEYEDSRTPVIKSSINANNGGVYVYEGIDRNFSFILSTSDYCNFDLSKYTYFSIDDGENLIQPPIMKKYVFDEKTIDVNNNDEIITINDNSILSSIELVSTNLAPLSCDNEIDDLSYALFFNIPNDSTLANYYGVGNKLLIVNKDYVRNYPPMLARNGILNYALLLFKADLDDNNILKINFVDTSILYGTSYTYTLEGYYYKNTINLNGRDVPLFKVTYALKTVKDEITFHDAFSENLTPPAIISISNDFLKKYKCIGEGAFGGCNRLSGSIILPKGIRSIGRDAFYECSNLTNLTILDTVTSIGASAFEGSNGLTDVTIGNGMTTIEDGTFRYCHSLTSITISDTVTSIGASAFEECRITSITIPDSVTKIGYAAFSSTKLTSVTIPDSVTVFNDAVFAYCNDLTSIRIGNGITSISDDVFYGCTSLNDIYFNGTISQWNSVYKYEGWADDIPSTCIVHCTDGDINI